MNDNERVNSHEPAFPVDVLLKLSGCAAPDSPPAAAAEPPPGMQTTVCSAQKAHHQRAESSITLTPVTLEKYDLDGDGRITRSDLMDILGTLKAQKTGKKVYRGVSLLAGLLLVLVVGVNAILTYDTRDPDNQRPLFASAQLSRLPCPAVAARRRVVAAE